MNCPPYDIVTDGKETDVIRIIVPKLYVGTYVYDCICMYIISGEWVC